MTRCFPKICFIVVILRAAGGGATLAQPAAVPLLECEFTLIATDRLPQVGYVQLKETARGKPRPTAADFDVIPVKVNSQGRSDVYRFVGPGPIRFVRTQGAGDALTAQSVIATWVGPAWSDRSLIALIPNEDESMSLMAFDDGPAAHQPQQVRLLNLSGREVAGILGRDSFSLGPEFEVSAPRNVSGNLKIGVSFERFGKPVVVFDQSITVGVNERLLLVFLPPFRKGADVRTRVVRDQVREVSVAN